MMQKLQKRKKIQVIIVYLTSHKRKSFEKKKVVKNMKKRMYKLSFAVRRVHYRRQDEMMEA